MRSIVLPLGLCAGCFGDETTEFPPGLEPLEPASVDLPGEVEETVVVAHGEGDDYEWAHARGYVRAGVDAVFEAMRDPAICVDEREVAEWTAAVVEGSEYEHEYVIHNTVEDVFTVEFDVTWRFGHVGEDGWLAARWRKTFGTSLISRLEGSVIVRPVDDELSEIEVVEQIDAAASGEEQIAHFVGDLHARIVARVHGQELPTYE